MLPLYAGDKEFRSGWKFTEKIKSWIRLIFSEKTSRNLFLFLLLNLSFAFVELAYGIWTNSLGLISDSFHMFFDCTALLAGLAASIISRWRSNPAYSYGYVRVEILAGFVNGLFLLFIAFFIFSEAVERMHEPPHVHHDRLFVISVAGFIVNLIGIFAFQHGHGHSHSDGDHGHSHSFGASHNAMVHSGGLGMDTAETVYTGQDNHHGHSHNGGKHEKCRDQSSNHGHSHSDHGHNHGSHTDHGHSHGQADHSHTDHAHSGHTDHGHSHNEKAGNSSQHQILQGVFLHILADTLGSVGVIISSGLIHAFGWMIADPICSIFIALLISISVIPLLRDSAGILMQRTPSAIENSLPGCYHRVSQLDGVYSVHEPHFWTLCSDVYIGTLKVEVAKDADAKFIVSQTHNIFTQIGVRQLYVQVDFSLL